MFQCVDHMICVWRTWLNWAGKPGMGHCFCALEELLLVLNIIFLFFLLGNVVKGHLGLSGGNWNAVCGKYWIVIIFIFFPHENWTCLTTSSRFTKLCGIAGVHLFLPSIWKTNYLWQEMGAFSVGTWIAPLQGIQFFKASWTFLKSIWAPSLNQSSRLTGLQNIAYLWIISYLHVQIQLNVQSSIAHCRRYSRRRDNSEHSYLPKVNL